MHSATVECGSPVATVTYDTTCEMPPPQGGTASTTKVVTDFKTETVAVTNRCNCLLTPSLGRTRGEISCDGDFCGSLDLTCN